MSLTPCTKMKTKLIRDLNAKCKTMKVLEENQGENLCDFGFDNGFLDTTPKAGKRN